MYSFVLGLEAFGITVHFVKVSMKMTVTGVMEAFGIVRAFRTTFPKTRCIHSRERHSADAGHGANMDEPVGSLCWHLAHIHGLSCILGVPRSQRWSCPVANSICCLKKHAIGMRFQPRNPNGKPRGKPMVSPRKSTVTHRAVHSKRKETKQTQNKPRERFRLAIQQLRTAIEHSNLQLCAPRMKRRRTDERRRCKAGTSSGDGLGRATWCTGFDMCRSCLRFTRAHSAFVVRAMRVPDDVGLYCILKCVCVWCAFKITTCRGLDWSFQMKNVFRSIASHST